MSIVLTILLAAAATLVLCAMIAGLITFSTQRAKEVRRHENDLATTDYTPTPQPRIITPSEERIDRHEYYIGVMMALWFAGVGILIVPIGAGALGALDPSTQKLLALAMMLGSSLSLLGSSLGASKRRKRWNPVRWWFPHFSDGHAYGVGAGGQIAIGVALSIFGWTVIVNGTLIGTVTGLLTPILSICAFRFARRLWAAHKRLNTQWWELRRAAEGER